MKKALFLFLPLLAIASPVEKPNLKAYETSKNIASILGDFNYVTENFGYKKDGNTISNNLSIGFFNHHVIYNIDSKEAQNTLSLSKNLTDFVVSKNLLAKQKYYVARDKLLKDYINALNAYSSYTITKLRLKNEEDLYSKLKLDEKVLKLKHDSGLISDIDYEYLSLEILESYNNIENLKLELKDLEKELTSYGVNSNEEFILPTLSDKKLKEYIFKENEKNTVNLNLYKAQKLRNILPDLTVSFDYHVEDKSYGFSINFVKAFTLDGSDILEYKLDKEYMPPKLSFEDEVKRYDLMKNSYELSKQKLEYFKKAYRIAEVKYSYGKISYKELIEEKIKLNNQEVEVLKAKNNLTIFILEKVI